MRTFRISLGPFVSNLNFWKVSLPTQSKVWKLERSMAEFLVEFRILKCHVGCLWLVKYYLTCPVNITEEIKSTMSLLSMMGPGARGFRKNFNSTFELFGNQKIQVLKGAKVVSRKKQIILHNRKSVCFADHQITKRNILSWVPHLLPHAQFSLHHTCFCRCREPMRRTKYVYVVVLL